MIESPGSRFREGALTFTYEIRANEATNRLYLRLTGFMTDSDAKDVADKIIEEIQKLKPGFDVINDISGLKPTTQTATGHLRRAQEASVLRGSRRVIRVVGDQAVTQLQWDRMLRETQGKGAEVAATIDAADQMLDDGG